MHVSSPPHLTAACPLTVNERIVEWLTPPPAAVIVTVKVPVVADVVAVNETVIVHVGLHGLSAKAVVTPDGRPTALKVTGTLVPLTRVASTYDERLVPP